MASGVKWFRKSELMKKVFSLLDTRWVTVCSRRPSRTSWRGAGVLQVQTLSLSLSLSPIPVFSTLIGRGQTMFGSYWSRTSECCLRQQYYAIKTRLIGGYFACSSLVLYGIRIVGFLARKGPIIDAGSFWHKTAVIATPLNSPRHWLSGPVCSGDIRSR